MIATGAWMTVKEQMPAMYATSMAKRGFAALTFDFRGWGQSKDKDGIQYFEDPARKTADIKAVIDAVSKLDLPEVDSSKILGLGVCASTGYMLDAVAGNDKVTAVASVAPWIHDREIVNTVYGGEEATNDLIAKAEKAPLSGDKVVILEAASKTNKDAVMFDVPYYTEKDRGEIPEFDNKFNFASWKPWFTYDSVKNALIQDKPTLLVASEAMALPAGTHKYLEKAGKNVKAIWLDNVTQFDFYDVPKDVNAASDAVADFFKAETK